MDTVEELDGKYFFNGMSLDKDELLLWLILDEFQKQFSGMVDLLAIASMLVSLPVIPVKGKIGKASGKGTSGSSPLSIASRTLIQQRFKKAKKNYYMGQIKTWRVGLHHKYWCLCWPLASLDWCSSDNL